MYVGSSFLHFSFLWSDQRNATYGIWTSKIDRWTFLNYCVPLLPEQYADHSVSHASTHPTARWSSNMWLVGHMQLKPNEKCTQKSPNAVNALKKLFVLSPFSPNLSVTLRAVKWKYALSGCFSNMTLIAQNLLRLNHIPISTQNDSFV